MKNDEIMHYASKYYDPVKAHEYYMQRRVLKGRTTSGYDTSSAGSTFKRTSEKTRTEQNEKRMKLKENKDLQEKLSKISDRIRIVSSRYSDAEKKKIRDEVASVIQYAKKTYRRLKNGGDIK